MKIDQITYPNHNPDLNHNHNPNFDSNPSSSLLQQTNALLSFRPSVLAPFTRVPTGFTKVADAVKLNTRRSQGAARSRMKLLMFLVRHMKQNNSILLFMFATCSSRFLARCFSAPSEMLLMFFSPQILGLRNISGAEKHWTEIRMG